jgi:hypothetical protein
MNYIRLGFTETNLLFLWYLDQKNIDNNNYIYYQNNLINWLCSTSGFYDKDIIGTYFNFDGDKIKYNKTYNEYFRKLYNFLKDNKNNHQLELKFHNINNLDIYKEEFIKEITNENNYNIDINSFMNNQNILIINNLGSLMKQQYESGNMDKINPNCTNIKSIQYYENGYTFLNNGPDSSILETADNICTSIKNIDFDVVIISAGAYSCLIADYIINNLKKNVYIIGGDLPLYFGIITKRIILHHNNKINEYFIEVPKEMRPIGYEKI